MPLLSHTRVTRVISGKSCKLPVRVGGTWSVVTDHCIGQAQIGPGSDKNNTINQDKIFKTKSNYQNTQFLFRPSVTKFEGHYQASPKGCNLEVGARRAPRLLVIQKNLPFSVSLTSSFQLVPSIEISGFRSRPLPTSSAFYHLLFNLTLIFCTLVQVVGLAENQCCSKTFQVVFK